MYEILEVSYRIKLATEEQLATVLEVWTMKLNLHALIDLLD